MNPDDLALLSKSLRRALRRLSWRLPLLGLLVGVPIILGLALTQNGRYEARASMVATRAEVPLEQLLPTISELFASPRIHDGVASALAAEDRGDLVVQVDLITVSGAPVLYVVGTADDQADAVLLANTAAEVFEQEFAELDELAVLQTFEAATIDGVITPSSLEGIMLGVLGAAAAIGVLVLLSVVAESPLQEVGTTARLQRRLRHERVGLAWLQEGRLSFDPEFNETLRSSGRSSWRVRCIDDFHPALEREAISILNSYSTTTDYSANGLLLIAPSTTRIGLALDHIDQQIAANKRFSGDYRFIAVVRYDGSAPQPAEAG